MSTPRFLSGLALLSGLAILVPPALAQGALHGPQLELAQAQQEQTQQRQARRPNPRMLEGRIAFLKATLDIRPEQQALWAPVEQALRANAEAMRPLMERARAQRQAGTTAIDRLELRAAFAKAHADAQTRYLEAFKPLYAALSDEQKKTADDILGGRGFGRRGGMRHG